MVSKKEIEHIAGLAIIGITHEELVEFTPQVNAVIDYFDILDHVPPGEPYEASQFNVFREDEVTPSFPQEEVLRNAAETEDGYFRAPRVM